MLSEHKYKHLISSIVSRPSNKRRRTEIGTFVHKSSQIRANLFANYFPGPQSAFAEWNHNHVLILLPLSGTCNLY